MTKKNIVAPLFVLGLFVSNKAHAQFPYFNSFKTSSYNGIVLGGDAKLTSGTEDAANNGFLRLTPAENNKRGFAYIDTAFPSTQGIKVEFEFYTWGGNNADGITFFLFDPANGFEIGQYGGALGYAQNNNNGTGLGMKNGFLAVGLDEYGNFGAATETKNGGFRDNTNTQYTANINANGLVAVRGAVGPNGEREGTSAYPFLGGKITNGVYGGTAEPLAADILPPADRFSIKTDSRGVLETDQDYRKVRMDIQRIVGTGFVINVEIFVGSLGRWVKVLNNFTYTIADSRVPATLKAGFSGSTGYQVDNHEIRNVLITPSAAVLDDPIARNDNAATVLNHARSVSVLVNDVDTVNKGSFQTGSLDLDPTTAVVEASKTITGKGVFTASSSGIITFTPENGFIGSAAIDYSFKDTYGAVSNSATLTVTVNAFNTLPTVAAINKLGTEDTPVVFSATDFVGKYTDPEDDALAKVKIVTLPANGTLKLNGIGVTAGQEIAAADLANISFVPDANWNGTTSFNWNGFDGTAYASANAAVNITISAVNDLPAVAAISKTGTEDVTVTFSATDFTTKFTDPDNDALTKIKVVTLPLNGTLKLNGTAVTAGQEIAAADLASITFVPDANWSGTTSFNWNGFDGTGYGSSAAAVNITISAVNDLPVVAAISKNGNKNTAISFSATDFSSKFTDPDNDALTKIKIVSLPLNGTLKLNGIALTVGQEIAAADLSTITFVPDANWNGTTSFNWNGFDGTAYAAANAAVNIAISIVNDPPTVAAIGKTGTEDVTVTFSATDFTSKFTDLDNNALSKIKIIDLPSNGTLKLNGTAVTAGQEIAAADLANITFVPDANWNGTTSFNWNGFDGIAYALTNAAVNITISAVNDLPTVAAISKTGTEDATVTFSATDFTSKFTDPENDVLTKIKVVSLPSNGTLKLNGTAVTVGQEIAAADLASITFVPDANWNGTTSFNWNGFDGTAYASANAAVNITISAVNDLPTVAAISKTGTEDVTVNFSATDFTSKFTDPENDVLTKIKVASLPANGTLKLNGTAVTVGQEIAAADLASITFVPDANWNGTTSFNWNGFDGTAYASANAAVNITISAVNDLPVVAAISKTGTEDATVTFSATDFTSKFTDPEIDVLTKIKVVSLPSNGTLKLNGTAITVGQEIAAADLANITFVPDANWNGTTSFNWNGFDGTAYASANAAVNITISAVNDLPTVAAISKSGNKNTTISFSATDFTSKFTDPENDALARIKVISLPSNGTLKLNGTAVSANQEITAVDLAKITFEPNSNWTGNTTFEWNGFDGANYATATATVTIAIQNVASAPVANNDVANTEINTAVDINILANDIPDGFSLDNTSVEIVAVAQHGSVQIGANGVLKYTPVNGFTGSDSFTYRVKDSNGSWSNIATISVTVKSFLVSNVFTPNNDGENDVFFIDGLVNYDAADLTVFNRWGNEVYHHSRYDNTWVGTGLNSGTYYYILKLKKGGTEQVKKGWVLLKR